MKNSHKISRYMYPRDQILRLGLHSCLEKTTNYEVMWKLGTLRTVVHNQTLLIDWITLCFSVYPPHRIVHTRIIGSPSFVWNCVSSLFKSSILWGHMKWSRDRSLTNQMCGFLFMFVNFIRGNLGMDHFKKQEHRKCTLKCLPIDWITFVVLYRIAPN
jgi:hypothetical protein